MLYQYPTGWDQIVVFAGNNRLWRIDSAGGAPVRLGDGQNDTRSCCISPCGTRVAFLAQGGIYLQSLHGHHSVCVLGAPKRMTWLAWRDADHLWFSSSWRSAVRENFLYSLHIASGYVEKINIGPCYALSLRPTVSEKNDINLHQRASAVPFVPQECVIQRHGSRERYGCWKHYKGGDKGTLWIDSAATGEFHDLLPTFVSTAVNPLWVRHQGEERIYFLSDHTGTGNVFSVSVQGGDIQQHTYHDLCVYHLSWVPETLHAPGYFLYSSAGLLYRLSAHPPGTPVDPQHATRTFSPPANWCANLLSVTEDADREEEVPLLVQQDAGHHVQHIALHPKGDVINVITKGRLFRMRAKSGIVMQSGAQDGARYYHAQWLQDGALCAAGYKNRQSFVEIFAAPPLSPSTSQGKMQKREASPALDILSEHCIQPSAEQTKICISDLTSHTEESCVEQLGSIDACARSGDAAAHTLCHTASKETFHASEAKGVPCVEPMRPQDAALAFVSQRTSRTLSCPESMGRICNMIAHPCKNIVAFGTYSHQVWILDMTTDAWHMVDKGAQDLGGISWSPCGHWMVYHKSAQEFQSDIYLWHAAELHSAPFPVVADGFLNKNAVFDPKGQYLYFLSQRHFAPQRDALFLSLGLENMTKIMCIPLKEGVPAPWLCQQLHLFASEDGKQDAASGGKSPDVHGHEDISDEEGAACAHKNPLRMEGLSGNGPCAQHEASLAHNAQSRNASTCADGEEKALTPTVIHQKDMQKRIVESPIAPGEYAHLLPLECGKILVLCLEKKIPTLTQAWDEEQNSYVLRMVHETWDKEEVLIAHLDDMEVCPKGKWMAFQRKHTWHTVSVGGREDAATPVDISGRINLTVNVLADYRFAFDEAWELQRQFFWDKDMPHVQWNAVYERYAPLAQRAQSLEELRDVLLDMQGELATSHAYVKLHEAPPKGASLGADLTYCAVEKGYVVQHLLLGQGNPLTRPGLRPLQVGDVILAVQGYEVQRHIPIERMLHNMVEKSVVLHVRRGQTQQEEHMIVFPISFQKAALLRYEAFVTSNKIYVHTHSAGRVGYVHIPDMDTYGYGQFLQHFVQEFNADALVIDARYNGGGNVSPFVIDLLCRRRVGYNQTRHHGTSAHPTLAPKGPMVLLINGQAGSDGDIFAKSFKMLHLGPVIGETTWGGIVGIWPRFGDLIEQRIETTQPEFSFFFCDDPEPWIEGHGVAPDVVVRNTPQAYARGEDVQLHYGVRTALELLHGERPLQVV